MGVTNINNDAKSKKKLNEIDAMVGTLGAETDNLKQTKLNNSDVVNDLTTGGNNKALSAEQGKVLDNKIKNIPTYTHPSTHPATMITQDSTHRFVSDSEKSAWNNKYGSGSDISRGKTGGYGATIAWQSVSFSRDLEDWIGDFDKRTRENKSAIDLKLDSSSIVNDLMAGGIDKPLSAEQGKVLNASLDDLKKSSAEYRNRIAAVLSQMDVAGISNETALGLLTQYLEDIPIIGAVNSTLTTQGGSYTIPRGYHNGSGRVRTDISNLRPENIKNGINVGGVIGSLNIDVKVEHISVRKSSRFSYDYYTLGEQILYIIGRRIPTLDNFVDYKNASIGTKWFGDDDYGSDGELVSECDHTRFNVIKESATA